MTPLQMAKAAIAADRAHADPAIWISRRPDKRYWPMPLPWKHKVQAGRSAMGRAIRREGQYRRGGDADHRRLSRFRLYPGHGRAGCAAFAGCGGAASGQDQSGSVRHRPRWHAQPLWRAAQCLRSHACSRRFVIRIRLRRRGWNRAFRARHRHGRIGPGTRRIRQYRWAEANHWQRVRARHGSRLSVRWTQYLSSRVPWTRRWRFSACSPVSTPRTHTLDRLHSRISAERVGCPRHRPQWAISAPYASQTQRQPTSRLASS